MVDLNVNEDERLDVAFGPEEDGRVRNIAAFAVFDEQRIRRDYLRNVLWLCMAQNGLCLALGICVVVIQRYDNLWIQVAHWRTELLMHILFLECFVGLYICGYVDKHPINLVLVFVSTISFALASMTTAHNHGISFPSLVEQHATVDFSLKGWTVMSLGVLKWLWALTFSPLPMIHHCSWGFIFSSF